MCIRDSSKADPQGLVVWQGLSDHVTVDFGFGFVSERQLAWLYSALAGVEKDRREPAFKLSARKHSHAITTMLANPPAPGKREGAWSGGARIESGELVLEWEGRRAPMQLRLMPDDGETIDGQIARSMVEKLGPDGLRDWLTLHRIAGEQGASGEFRWSWEEHRARTDYERRVREKNANDSDLARETRRRLWRFKRAELWAETTQDGKTFRKRVGPFGLIDIDAEIIEDRDTPIVAAGKLNPYLYGGARTGGEKPLYTLIPEAALALPSNELSIATLVAFPWRVADDDKKGRATVKARTLWEYGGIPEPRRKDKRRWPDCRRTTEKRLDSLRRTLGVSWEGGGDGPDALYTLNAPLWWKDRVVHKVPPALPSPATVAVPRTGPELGAARKARGLSLDAVARALGVNRSTVMRAERREAPLPPDWLPKLAAVRFTMPG